MQGGAAPMPGIFDVLQQIRQQRPDLSPQQIQQALSQLQPEDWDAFFRPPLSGMNQQPSRLPGLEAMQQQMAQTGTQNRYDPGASIRPPMQGGGPPPAFGQPSPWNQPPQPFGFDAQFDWSRNLTGKNQPMQSGWSQGTFRRPFEF